MTLAAAWVLWLAIGVAAPPEAGNSSPLPPLEVAPDAPLLLEETEARPVVPGQQPAPHHLICYDCHGNLREESLSAQHARAGTSCTDCHGPSHEHAEDEGNTTPPTVMFARAAIAAQCQSCHPTHDAPATDVIRRWRQRRLQRLRPETIVCTDCHGQHRLPVRTVRWDKSQGQLLPGATR